MYELRCKDIWKAEFEEYGVKYRNKVISKRAQRQACRRKVQRSWKTTRDTQWRNEVFLSGVKSKVVNLPDVKRAAFRVILRYNGIKCKYVIWCGSCICEKRCN